MDLLGTVVKLKMLHSRRILPWSEERSVCRTPLLGPSHLIIPFTHLHFCVDFHSALGLSIKPDILSWVFRYPFLKALSQKICLDIFVNACRLESWQPVGVHTAFQRPEFGS